MASGVPDAPPTHTATHQWQSFEMRMRQRRIDRLLVRTDAAIEAGDLDAARDAVDELDILTPGSPRAAELRARLTPPHTPPPLDDLVLNPAVPIPSEPLIKRRGIARAAVLLLALAGVAWFGLSGAWVPLFEGASQLTSSTAPPTGATGHVAANSPQPVQVEVHDVTAPASTKEESPPPVEREQPLATSRDTPSPESPGDAPVTPSGIHLPPAATTLELPPVTSPPPQMPSVPPAPVEPTSLEPTPALPPPVSAVSSAGTATPIDTSEMTSSSRALERDDAGVRASLERYESAYSRLDVGGATAVFPGLDRRALARAFDGLSSQRVNLGSCDVRFVGDAAVAECQGSATWTPKVGGGSHREARRWQFKLRNAAGSWQIVGATVR